MATTTENAHPEPGATLETLRTPALIVDREIFVANTAAMDKALPGRQLRPHVKAFKSTAIAKLLAADGHLGFCAATPREIEGLAQAGLTEDLMLANETLEPERLGRVARDYDANITVAVDSDPVLDAAIAGGIRSVILDIDVGMPRCGCDAETAERLADRARKAGLEVRGVMGYEGHLMMVHDVAKKTEEVASAMAILLEASARVGGEVISGGGTGTFSTNPWCTEIQAGSYCLLDTEYDELDLPFEIALTVMATVISKSPKGWIVVDAGLKAFGMDHGNPRFDDGDLLYCADEHAVLIPNDMNDYKVGDRVRLKPAHVDPTVARHREMWVVEGTDIVDHWPIDLRHW